MPEFKIGDLDYRSMLYDIYVRWHPGEEFLLLGTARAEELEDEDTRWAWLWLALMIVTTSIPAHMRVS